MKSEKDMMFKVFLNREKDCFTAVYNGIFNLTEEEESKADNMVKEVIEYLIKCTKEKEE